MIYFLTVPDDHTVDKQLKVLKRVPKKAQNQDQMHFATKVQKHGHLENTVLNEKFIKFINYPSSKQDNFR